MSVKVIEVYARMDARGARFDASRAAPRRVPLDLTPTPFFGRPQFLQSQSRAKADIDDHED